MPDIVFPLLLALVLDWLLGDPVWLPHPVVGFGRVIAFCEHRLNKGHHYMLKGAFVAVGLIASAYAATSFLIYTFSFLISALLIFLIRFFL
jgi:adenosylcobinamide-phosphate synthase